MFEGFKSLFRWRKPGEPSAEDKFLGESELDREEDIEEDKDSEAEDL